MLPWAGVITLVHRLFLHWLTTIMVDSQGMQWRVHVKEINNLYYYIPEIIPLYFTIRGNRAVNL